ncbi:MAG: TrmO family methyltransferase [Odoribacter sp.]
MFSFHQEKRTELLTRRRSGETKGIFASRSPKRPNHLGVTTVKLIKGKTINFMLKELTH